MHRQNLGRLANFLGAGLPGILPPSFFTTCIDVNLLKEPTISVPTGGKDRTYGLFRLLSFSGGMLEAGGFRLLQRPIAVVFLVSISFRES